jgi:hypothetical protein
LESATIAAHDPDGAAPDEKGLRTVPLLGGLPLTGIFIRALIDYGNVERTYSGNKLVQLSETPVPVVRP